MSECARLSSLSSAISATLDEVLQIHIERICNLTKLVKTDTATPKLDFCQIALCYRRDITQLALRHILHKACSTYIFAKPLSALRILHASKATSGFQEARPI